MSTTQLPIKSKALNEAAQLVLGRATAAGHQSACKVRCGRSKISQQAASNGRVAQDAKSIAAIQSPRIDRARTTHMPYCVVL